MNPPYSRAGAFVKKAHAEWKKGKTVIMLLKSHNLNTEYAKKYIRGAEIRILTKRLIFPGYKRIALFFSVLVIWRAGKRSTKYVLV